MCLYLFQLALESLSVTFFCPLFSISYEGGQVSPLIALMQDQVSAATAMGVSAIHITDKHATKSIVKQSVKNGEYQIVSGEVYRDAQLPLRLHRFMFVSTC